MPPTITRTAITDDDGTLTTGTVINNAWKTELYDQIDAVISSEDAVVTTVPHGGTGVATLAAHGVVVGEGASSVAVVGPDATTGKPLLSAGALADPAFGDLGVAHGGTGATTLTAHGVLIGEGTSAVVATTAGTAGQALRSGGASVDPSFGEIVQTTTSTGAVNDFALTAGAGVLRCNNATLLTLTGIAAGFSGQRLVIQSVGAGQVDLSHQDAGSTTAGDRFINFATVGKTSLAAGVGVAEYEYDATTARWRLVSHDQGTWIAYVPTYSGNGAMTYGTVTTTLMRYRLRGRDVTIAFDVTGTVGGTLNTLLQFTLPVSMTAAASAFQVYNANLAASALCQTNGAGVTTLGFYKDATAAGNWVAGSARLLGTVTVEVQ